MVWVAPGKLNLNKPVHPPFKGEALGAIEKIREDLLEVLPRTVTEWEDGFRRDQRPEKEIRIWRWIAYTYNRLTQEGEAPLERKKDYLNLILKTTMTSNPEEILETTAFNQLSREEVLEILDFSRTTPGEFFGGEFGKANPNVMVFDLSSIRSVEEFKELVAPADVIFAVDWEGRRFDCLYGLRTLKESTAGKKDANVIHFAIDYDSDHTNALCAMVGLAKGWYEWNGEIHEVDPEDADER